MTRRLLAAVAAAAAAAIVLALLCDSCFAQSRGEWFKSLKQPGSGFSCCDISDCRKTDADWRDGQWFAEVGGEMTPIPPDKELDVLSIDGEAYVCASPSRRIYCFVKPGLGS